MTITTFQSSETGQRGHSSSLVYQPALDGLRAFAVVTVLVFHAGFGWMTGGYLGVSVFFTLSGYLITSLLLVEFDKRGRNTLGRFIGRRVARLVPASAMCIALILLARAFGAFSTVPHLGGDALGAGLQVFNWWKLSQGGSYGDLFAAGTFSITSPFEHYWSLAVEEQFYWLWPVVLWELRWTRGRGLRLLRTVGVMTVGFAVAAPLIAWMFGPDAAYWSTPARLAEILVGACLAIWIDRRRGARGLAIDRSTGATGDLVPPLIRRAGPVAIAGLLALSMVLPVASGPAYQGLLPLVAVLSAVVIWSLQAPGPIRTVLSNRALVATGRVSYGLYLYHWPVYVVLRERGWNLDTTTGFGTAMAITVLISVMSYRLLERPIREAGWAPRRVIAVGVATSVVLAALALLVVPKAEPLIKEDTRLLNAAAIDPSVADGPLAPLASATTVGPATSVEPVTSVGPVAMTTEPIIATSTSTTFPAQSVLPSTAPSRPVRVLVVGDSTALYLGQGLAAWSLDHPEYAQVSVTWCQGCGFVLDGAITSFDGADFVQQSREVVGTALPAAIAALRPDVVVLMSTVDDLANRQWTEAEGPLSPTDARFRLRLAESYRAITDKVLALGVPRVAWVVPPTPVVDWPAEEMRDPARWIVQHEVIRGLADGNPAHVGLVDLAAWFDATDRNSSMTLRPDGVHFTEASAALVAEQFVGPNVVLVALGRP